MANMAFGWPIYSDTSVSYTPAFAAFGSWAADLPLTNLQDPRFALVARSSDATTASTKFRIDLGVARAVGMLAFPKHNLSAGATIQWKGGTSAGASDVYNPGALALSFAAVTAENRVGINFPAVLVPATPQTARYWECLIVDTANVDGYVQLARLVIAGIYQPAINMLVGADTGLRTETDRKSTDGGAYVFQAKAVRRTASLVLDDIAESEAQASAWTMQRLLGKHGQVMFVFNTADMTYLHERSFLATLEELSGLEYPYAISRNRTAVKVLEVL